MGKLLLVLLFTTLITADIKANYPHQFYIAPDVYFRDYDEELEAPKKSHEFGMLYGLQAGYSFIQLDRYYFGADLRYSYGETVYDGSIQNLLNNEITPYRSHTENNFVNFETRVGMTYGCQRLQYIPFVGIGGQYWYRGPARDNRYGYAEEYIWGYFSFGIKTIYSLNSNWSIGLNLKGMQMFSGTMYIPSMNQLRFSLGNLLQYEIELPIIYIRSNTCSFLNQISFVSYFRNQNIGKSNEQSTYLPDIGFITLYEPRSVTYVVGARIELTHDF
jgi:hypothetical protein